MAVSSADIASWRLVEVIKCFYLFFVFKQYLLWIYKIQYNNHHNIDYKKNNIIII